MKNISKCFHILPYPYYIGFVSFILLLILLVVSLILRYINCQLTVEIKIVSLIFGFLLSIVCMVSGVWGMLIISFPLKRTNTQDIHQKRQDTNSQERDLISQLLLEKNSNTFITYAFLFISFIEEVFLYIQIQKISILWTMILTVFLLFGSFIQPCILNYRVIHGLYGTCYSEAKEIVAFILEWQRKNGDSNHKPPKLVLKQEEIEQCLQVNGGEEYAG